MSALLLPTVIPPQCLSWPTSQNQRTLKVLKRTGPALAHRREAILPSSDQALSSLKCLTSWKESV